MGKKIKAKKTSVLSEAINELGCDMIKRFMIMERRINSINERIDNLEDYCTSSEFVTLKVEETEPVKYVKVPENHIVIDFDTPPVFQKQKEDKEDVVNHPNHYTDGKYEVIDFIHQYTPLMDAGNAVKYISRAGKKDEDKYIEDLEKARWYLYSCHELIHSFPGLIQFCTDYRKNYCNFTGKEKINVGDYCKDKKLPFELTKVMNYIVLDEYYTAYCELHKYIGYLEELGHEPN